MPTNNSINLSASGITSYDGSGTFFGRTLQAGTNVTITNPDGIAGNPLISVSGLSSTVDVTGTSQAMAVSTNYIADSSSLITFTLPSTAALGDSMRVMGKGAGLWKIVPQATQQIILGKISSTVGITGLISSLFSNDSVELRCITAGTATIWSAFPLQGNITVA